MIGSINSNESTWRGKSTRRLGGADRLGPGAARFNVTPINERTHAPSVRINDQAVVGGVDPQGPDAAPTYE